MSQALTQEAKQALVQAALEAQRQAYVPYSHFRVGAAVLDDQQQLSQGCNIENSSYGATCCAERVAIFKAIASGARRIKALAVVTAADEYARPCGICRQVISEFADTGFILLAAKPDGSFIEHSLDELLPFAFGPASLEKNKKISD